MLNEYEYEYAEFLYYNPRSFDKESGLWPIRAGRNVAKPHYRVGPKRIECFSLHVVEEGELRFEFEDASVSLKSGSLFCLFPGATYHYAIATSESPLRMSWVAVDGPRIKPLLELAGITAHTPYRRQINTTAVMEPVLRMHQLLRDADGGPGAALELQSRLLGLFSLITLGTGTAQPSEPVSWLEASLDFMKLHAAEGVSVQQVAAFAGVHRSHFTSVFSRQVGQSPHSYLLQLRMEKAKELLRETDATITEIALSLGYPNLFSFTRSFKHYCNVPPGVYRREHAASR